MEPTNPMINEHDKILIKCYERDLEVYQKYMSGTSTKELALEYDVSVDTISKRVKKIKTLNEDPLFVYLYENVGPKFALDKRLQDFLLDIGFKYGNQRLNIITLLKEGGYDVSFTFNALKPIVDAYYKVHIPELLKLASRLQTRELYRIKGSGRKTIEAIQYICFITRNDYKDL